MKADNRKNRICRALHSSRPAVWLLGLAVLTLGTAACSREGAVPPAATALETSAVYAPAAQETGNISPEATTEVRYADKQNAPMGTVFPGEEIQSVVVYGEKGTSELCAPEDIARALAVLEDLYDADTTVDGYDPDRDPDPWHMNMIGLATAGEKSEFNFSGDGALVWFCDGGEAVTAFPVKEPQAVKDFVAGYMRSTRGKTTGGTPAAGIDEPVKWLKNVTFDAIRDVYLHRSVLLPGSPDSHGSTFGSGES